MKENVYSQLSDGRYPLLSKIRLRIETGTVPNSIERTRFVQTKIYFSREKFRSFSQILKLIFSHLTIVEYIEMLKKLKLNRKTFLKLKFKIKITILTHVMKLYHLYKEC